MNLFSSEIMEELLRQGVDDQQQQSLSDYLALLIKWNHTYNLTAVRDPAQMVIRHLLDSLSIKNLVSGRKVLDVGSGAGLPGIPLAIALPQQRIVLLDSNGKKTRFLQHVKLSLGLSNVEVIKSRVETFSLSWSFPNALFPPDNAGYDCITARAYSSLEQLIKTTAHLLANTGEWIAMKGKRSQSEIETLPDNLVVDTKPLSVFGLQEQRHAVLIKIRT